jgi:hypothetical protein
MGLIRLFLVYIEDRPIVHQVVNINSYEKRIGLEAVLLVSV